MARKNYVDAVLGPWEPRPISREEALDSRANHDGYYKDGFGIASGGEAPSDQDIDDMVFPQDRGPFERRIDDVNRQRNVEADVFRAERTVRSRDFCLNPATPCGAPGTYPDPFDKDE